MSSPNGLKIYFPLIVAASLALGIYLGSNLNAVTSQQNLLGYSSRSNDSYNKLNDILNYIEQEYVDTVSRKQIVESTVQHMLQELDPHSYYISADELAEMNEPLEGSFDGIGVQFNITNDTIIVITPVSGGPSEKVGIQAGDRIVEVDGKIVAGVGITNREVLKMLKGKKGTEVTVGIKRNGKSDLSNFTIVRDAIPLYSIDVSYMLNDTTGYIKLSKFSRTTYDEFIEAGKTLKEAGMRELVLDLRGNGGGFLDAATRLADEFLKEDLLIVYTEGKARPRRTYFATSKGQFEDIGLKILIDEGSASASEIIAGAIQDNDRGVIYGRRSFGKGLVQEQTPWPDGSATRLTIARYYTPTGRCIQKPYESGDIEDYNTDLNNRYLHGELSAADSISFPDSLKYTTPKGKVVYGGGGIMPDIFVPIDTEGGSWLLSEISYRGIINQFAFDFVDKHRDMTDKYNTAEKFDAGFNVDENLLSQFQRFIKQKNVTINQADWNRSKAQIKMRVKAQIGRNLLNDEAFYRALNKNDKTLLKAVKS